MNEFLKGEIMDLGIKINMVLGDNRERNGWLRKIEKEDDRRFYSVSVGIPLTNFVADTLQNYF